MLESAPCRNQLLNLSHKKEYEVPREDKKGIRLYKAAGDEANRGELDGERDGFQRLQQFNRVDFDQQKRECRKR
jgi:hypothetical protein